MTKQQMELGEDSRSVCSNCKEKINKNLFRVSFSYNSAFGIRWIRICEKCIKEFYEEIEKERKEKNLKNIITKRSS